MCLHPVPTCATLAPASGERSGQEVGTAFSSPGLRVHLGGELGISVAGTVAVGKLQLQRCICNVANVTTRL